MEVSALMIQTLNSNHDKKANAIATLNRLVLILLFKCLKAEQCLFVYKINRNSVCVCFNSSETTGLMSIKLGMIDQHFGVSYGTWSMTSQSKIIFFIS